MKNWEYHLHEHVWVELHGRVGAGTEHTTPKEQVHSTHYIRSRQ